MEFLVFALLAGLGVAITAAPLGAFVVWQRMAYFGDSLAHSALLGVAFGLFLSVNVQITIFVSSVLVAAILLLLQYQRQLPIDTLLGIISHSALAFGLILVSVVDSGRLDLGTYLLGDILSTEPVDLAIIALVMVAVISLVWRYWSSLLAVSINEATAHVEGIAVKRMQFLLLLLLALTIAVAIKIVGVLLITALLIIPAASARFLAKTPEQMVFIAGFLGCSSVCLGLLMSLYWDTPAGPSIVASASCLFLLILFGCRMRGH